MLCGQRYVRVSVRLPGSISARSVRRMSARKETGSRPPSSQYRAWSYLAHGSGERTHRAFPDGLTDGMMKRKRRPIECIVRWCFRSPGAGDRTLSATIRRRGPDAHRRRGSDQQGNHHDTEPGKTAVETRNNQEARYRYQRECIANRRAFLEQQVEDQVGQSHHGRKGERTPIALEEREPAQNAQAERQVAKHGRTPRHDERAHERQGQQTQTRLCGHQFHTLHVIDGDRGQQQEVLRRTAYGEHRMLQTASPG